MSPRIPPRVFARARAILRLTSESGRDGSLSFPAGVVRRLVRSFLLVRFDTFVGFDFLGFQFKGEQLHVAPDRIRKWKKRFETIQRGVLRTHTDASPAAQLQAVVDAFHREISSSGSRHIGYYAMADDLSVYQEVDRYLSRMLGRGKTVFKGLLVGRYG